MEEINFAFLVKEQLILEKRRVATGLKLDRLEEQGREDETIKRVFTIYKKGEEEIERMVGNAVKEYPLWNWFREVQGIGEMNAANIIGLIEAFGTYYKYCPKCKKELGKVKGSEIEVCPYCETKAEDKFLSGIQRLTRISKLWKYAGLAVENGSAAKPQKGVTLGYNSELKSVLLGRVATSLMLAKGKYYRQYLRFKKEETEKCKRKGLKIKPTPKTRGKEPEGIIYEGHIDKRAKRKMIKLFTAHLWTLWRKSEGLPVTEPYAKTILGHTDLIDPWAMTRKHV